MEKMERWATLVALADEMRDHGSWCGETHLQKSVYLLQELAGVELDFDFVLYKHGPFSFDFRDELGVMRARAVIERRPQSPPYGPTLHPTPTGQRTAERHEEVVGEVRDRIEYIAWRLGDKDVAELERIATAYFVTDEEGLEDNNVQERVERLVELKPHVSPEEARRAVEFVDEMRDDVRGLGT